MPRGHCHDWFRKWKREHNFCGLRPQDAKEMDRYIELTEKIAASGAGIDEDFIHDHFTAGAARPLLRCKDESAYEKSLNYVVACLKRGETITGGDLQATIAGFSGKGKSTQMRTGDAPPQPSLADQMHTGKNSSVHLEPGPVQTPPPSPETAIRQQEMEAAAANQKAVTEAPEWTPDTCRKGPCPDGGNHTRLDKIRGLVCQLSNSVCKEMTYCHIIERRKRAEALGFVPGGSAAPAGTSVSAKVVPIRLTREEANDRIRSVVRGYLTESSQRSWEAIRKTGELGEMDIEIFQGLLDEAAGRMG